MKKAFSFFIALTLVFSPVVPAFGATAVTQDASGTWSSSGNHLDDGTIAEALTTADLTIGAGRTITVQNNNVADDNSGNKNTFVLGTVSNAGGTGSLIINTGASVVGDGTLNVTVGAATIGGSFTVENLGSSTKSTTVSITNGLTLNGAGNLTVANYASTDSKTVDLTVGGDFSTVTSSVMITSSVNAVTGANSTLILNGASISIAGGVTLYDNAGGSSILTFNRAGDQTITAAINGGGAGQGALNVTGTGDTTFNSAVGTTSLKEINIAAGSGKITTFGDIANATTITMTGAGTAQFDDAVTATDLNLSSTGTVILNATLTGDINFSDDGTVQLADGENITGNIATSNGGEGNLVLKGAHVVGGTVGTSSAALNTITADGLGTLTDLQGDVYAGTLNFGADGEVQVNGTAGFETVDNTTGSDQSGTLTFLGAATIAGNVGDSNSLKAVNAYGTGTISGGDGVDFQGDFNVDVLNFYGDGEVRIAGSATLTGNIANNTGGDNMGTVIFEGNATIASGIGLNTACLKIVDISGAVGTTVTVNDDLYAQDVLIDAGELYMNGDLRTSSLSTVKFQGDGLLTLANGGYQIVTSIVNDTGTDKQGTLAFEGDGTVTNSIGASGAALKAINANGNDTVYLQGDVYGDTVSFGNDGELDISGTAELGTVTNDSGSDGFGTLTFQGSGTITGDVGVSGASLNTINANGSGATLDLQGTVYVSALNFGNDGTINLADGKNLNGAVTNNSGSTAGTLNFLGDSTVSGDVSASGAELNQVGVNGAAGTNVLFKGDVYATTLNFGGDGSFTMGTKENIYADVTTAADGTGELIFKGSSNVNGNIGVSGTAVRLITLSGGSGRDVLFKGDVYATTLNFDDDGSATMGTNETLNANVTTSNDGAGELIFKGSGTVTGDVGAIGAVLRQISATGVGKTVTLDGDIFANQLDFSGDGTVRIQTGHNLNAAVTTSAGPGTGTLTFLGSTTTGGNIGAAGAQLLAVNFNGGSSNLGHDIAATTTAIDTGATLTLTGDRAITGDLTLAGSGGAGTGTLELGANLLTLSGTYTQDAAAQVLSLSITDATTYGKIDASATGTAAFSAGTVNVTLGGATIANGTQFTIFDAAGGTVTTAGITVTVVDSTTVTFDLRTTGDDLILTAVTGRGGTFQSASTNGNIEAVGAVFDQIESGGGGTGDMQNVIDTLNGMTSDEEVANAMGTMMPDMSSGSMQASLNLSGQNFTMISNRLGGMRNGFLGAGVSAGEMLNGVGVWLQGLGSHMKQDPRRGVEGYQANLFGTTVGADQVIDRHFRAGLAGSYGFARVKSKTAGSPSDDINSFQGTIYGSYDSLDLCEARQSGRKSYEAVRSQVENSWYADGMFAFTQNNYDSRREIWLTPATKRVAKADHYGQQYSTNFEAGYKFVFEKTKNLEITPFASLGYSYLYMNKYKEDGAGALNLTVNGEGFHQLEQGLGTKLAYPIFAKKVGTFIPSVKAAWLYDYIGDQFETTASFAGGGPSFETNGAKPAKNGMLFGAELAFLNKGNVTATGNWDIELKDQFMSNTYYGTIRYDF